MGTTYCGPAAWRREHGAFDLPSITTGVIAVSILSVGVLVTIAGMIPASQDDTARESLGLVATAQNVAYIKDHRYLDTDALTTSGYLTAGDRLQAAASEDGGCYVGLSESETGRFFYITGADAEPRPLTDYTDPGCVNADTIEDLIGPPPPVPEEPPPPPPPGYDEPDPKGNKRYAFCHHGFDATANVNGIMNGHNGHLLDIIPPIPAHNYPGLNWTAENAETFYNACELRESTFTGIP